MPAIILCNPQMGENIGATARAMQNFGLNDLRIVNPRDGWPNEKAIKMSSGAFDTMPPPQIFEDLESAIANLHFTFATTARQRDMVKPTFTPEGAAIESYKKANQKIGILFGAERSGLLNDEIIMAQAIINIPTNPNFSSLNLGQSVLLMAYEWSKHAKAIKQSEAQKQNPATQKDIQGFLSRLKFDLDENNFFRSKDLKQTMIRNIENIFVRNDLTHQEVKTLHGILSALRGNKSPK
ncbi:MAG: RNA methyltransferase [Alphaproteobacteria bacterium]